MKNEKFCFSKGTGLIALVGIFLVLAVFFMNSATNEKTSTGAKAFLQCPNSSLADFTGLCPNAWVARDASGNIFTSTNNDVNGNPAKCCYFGTNYSGECPNGSSPDPNLICAASRVVPGAHITKKSSGAQVRCCNFIGTVQNTPAPVVTQTAAVVPTVGLQTHNYCSDLNLYPVLSQAYETAYRNMYCTGAENTKTAWNGLWGTFAKCYNRTGACGRSANCTQDSCMAALDGKAGCIYRPLTSMNECIAAKTAPADVVNFTCPPKDAAGRPVEVYLDNGSGKYYLQAGRVFYPKSQVADGRLGMGGQQYAGAAPYCVNKELTSAETTAAKAAGKIKTVAPKDCSTTPATYGWGPSFKTLVIDWRDTSKPEVVWAQQSVCYRLNASNGTACALNVPTAIELCQCKDFKVGKSATQKAKAEEQTQCKAAHQIDPTFQY